MKCIYVMWYIERCINSHIPRHRRNIWGLLEPPRWQSRRQCIWWLGTLLNFIHTVNMVVV